MKIKNFESFINENDNNDDDLLQLEVGDTVNVECYTGMGTGGQTTVDKILYKYDKNTGEKYKVIVVDDNHQFDSRTGGAITPPTMYYIWVPSKNELNEELSPKTYNNAAEKLSKKGHKTRAERIKKHQKDQIKNVKPITLQMYGEEYTIDHNNVLVYDNSDIKEVFINFKSKPLTDEEYNNMSDEQVEEYEMTTPIGIVHFDLNSKKENKWYYEGLIIPDRKNARKLLMFLKDYFSYYGGWFGENIDKLTINDLYED